MDIRPKKIFFFHICLIYSVNWMSQTVESRPLEPRGVDARNRCSAWSREPGDRQQVEGERLLQGEWIAQGKVEAGVVL